MSATQVVLPVRENRRSLRANLLMTPQLIDAGLRFVDFLLIAVSGLISVAALPKVFLIADTTVLPMAMALLISLFVFPLFGTYDRERYAQLTYQLLRVSAALGVTLAGVVVVMFMLKGVDAMSRLWVSAWFVSGAVMIIATRCVLRGWIRSAWHAGELSYDVLVIGAGTEGDAHRAELSGQDAPTRVIGYVDLSASLEAGSDNDIADELRSVLTSVLTGRNVDHVAIALPREAHWAVAPIVKALRRFSVEVSVALTPVPFGLPILGVTQFGDTPHVTLLERPLDSWQTLLKGLADRCLAMIALILLSPIMAIIALAVRLTSKGPVLFRQQRYGFNQQMIEVLKFRSMYVDRCDEGLSDNVQQATRNDPRVTPIGRFLRRSSLDELPQLFNVLRGEMSLVGPRPHAVAHDDYYAALIDGYLGRHRVKPGITGWAQVNGFRGETETVDDMRRRIELDLDYIDHWTLGFDFRILARTVFLCLKGTNAY
ncbi:MAG: undecaprenyl-phosphate glucose phosphotransferase [Geminicoccaceae bacterium]